MARYQPRNNNNNNNNNNRVGSHAVNNGENICDCKIKISHLLVSRAVNNENTINKHCRRNIAISSNHMCPGLKLFEVIVSNFDATRR